MFVAREMLHRIPSIAFNSGKLLQIDELRYLLHDQETKALKEASCHPEYKKVPTALLFLMAIKTISRYRNLSRGNMLCEA